ADIYSAGVLAYELRTGQPPFAGRTPQNVLAAHVTEAPEAINRRRASLPPALAALVMRCLEKRPADRPQSASEVVHALDDITTPSGGMTPTGTHASRGGSRRWGAIAAAAAAVVLVIVIASWLLATRAGGAAKLRSIAVLPPDIGAGTAHAFLADGLSSDLTTKLSTIPGLSVRAYAPLSVMHGRTVREAGKELGVGAIVMVRMARSGTQLRATASLVNTANDDLLWSEAFAASDQDQFALQDALVSAIAPALDPTLADAHAQVAIWALTYGHDPRAASKEMEQALRLDSANVAAGAWYPFLLTNYVHLPDSAQAVAQRAQRLNPLSFGVWNPFFLSLDFAKLSPDSARPRRGVG